MLLINTHVYPEGRGLGFGLSHHLHPYFVFKSSEGSDESGYMLAACLCDKYQNPLCTGPKLFISVLYAISSESSLLKSYLIEATPI